MEANNAQPLKKLKYIQKSVEQEEPEELKKKVINIDNNHSVYIDKNKPQAQRKGPMQNTQTNHN